jgi:hypothetical protein
VNVSSSVEEGSCSTEATVGNGAWDVCFSKLEDFTSEVKDHVAAWREA